MSSSGSVIAPIVVTSHTTTVVASQDAVPSIVSPCVNTDARINATIVNAKPVPPRSSDAYRWGNFKIDRGQDRLRYREHHYGNDEPRYRQRNSGNDPRRNQ